MLPPVFQTLKSSNDVKAIVGTTFPRIFRHGEADPAKIKDAQGNVLPYITWLLVSGVPELNLSDPPPADRQSVQVDCWHTTDKGVEDLGRAVRDALEPTVHVTSYENFPRDPETRRFRISVNADFWGR